MTLDRLPASYRDPSGFLFRHQGTLYRSVAPPYAPHYDALSSSGLYEELTAAGLLIPHGEVPSWVDATFRPRFRVVERVELPGSSRSIHSMVRDL
jgi:hypothetical protein